MTQSFRMVLCAVGLMCGVAACAQLPPQGIPPSRWSYQDLTLIRGAVMCAGCSLEEARLRYPDTEDLYEFTGPQGQVVFRVDWVNDAVRWRQLTLGNRLSVRADDQVFRQLITPEHHLQQMELNTLLRDEHTLDIGSVTVLG